MTLELLCSGQLLDQLQQAHFGGITAAAAQLVDAGVTTFAFGIFRSDHVKELFDSIFIAELGESQTTVVNITFFADGDQTFGKTACFFSLDQSGLDLTMEEKAADHVGQHRPAVSSGTGRPVSVS